MAYNTKSASTAISNVSDGRPGDHTMEMNGGSTPPPLQKILPAVFLFVELISVGLPKKNREVVTGIVLGELTPMELLESLARSRPQSLASPLAERRGRATSPVAHLSVWLIPWLWTSRLQAVVLQVRYCLGIMKGNACCKAALP